MARTARLASLVVASLVLGLPSLAPAQPAGAPSDSAPPARASGQGIAVLAIGSSRDEAFALARAIYTASRELRKLAEVRAGITGEDAAGRRLLAGLAQQVGAEALLVVRVERNVGPVAPAGPTAVADAAGAPAAATTADARAAAPAAPSSTGNAVPTTTVVARLFLAEPGDFDAARYSADPGLEGPAAWRSTVTSPEARQDQGRPVALPSRGRCASRVRGGPALATSPLGLPRARRHA